MSNLNEKTTVPLIWVGTLLVAVLSVGAAGVWKTAFWVSRVNVRLVRLEQAMRLEPLAEDAVADNKDPFFDQAEAGSRIFHAPKAQRRENGTGR
jgi:hypothetical protein